MKESKEILTSVLHTAQMGQSGIRAVLHSAGDDGLQQFLRQQLLEYKTIEMQALHLAAQKGWELPHRSMAVEAMSNLCAKCRLIGGDKDSAIAGMLIQGNSRGMILGIKNLHKASAPDAEVVAIAKRLLNLENTNLEKSKHFL